jgi:hypothetical protein
MVGFERAVFGYDGFELLDGGTGGAVQEDHAVDEPQKCECVALVEDLEHGRIFPDGPLHFADIGDDDGQRRVRLFEQLQREFAALHQHALLAVNELTPGEDWH